MRILSGMRPTGMLHLGNYFGAIRQFLDFQQQNCERFYFVADLHALTTATGPFNVYAQSVEIARGYLACGLDPNISSIYKQSDIPKIPYLSLLFGMFTSEPWLRKCTTYKEKAAKQEITSLGLLAYPVLMAADILILRSNLVPVGHDQLQHLEMTRDIALKFNTNYGGDLVLPEAIKVEAIRVPGLDGGGKMGKSDQNYIGLFEDPKVVEKKVMAAVTDSGETGPRRPSQPVQNLLMLLELMGKQTDAEKYREMFARGERKFYGELKKNLAKSANEFLGPFRQKYNSSEASPARAEEALRAGAAAANAIAEKTFAEAFACFKLQP